MLFMIGILNFIMSFRNIVDSDYGWHISVGRYIFENLSIPKNDVFSWYGISNNLEFISHEWLSDLIMYILGDFGVVIFMAISILIMYFLIVKLLKFSKQFNISDIFKFIWLLLCIVMLGSLNHRPYLFSYILFLIFIYILFMYINNQLKNDKLIYIIPVLQLLWVNLHGGSSSLIPIILLIYIVISYINIISDRRKCKNIFLIFILSIVFSFINPYGYKILLYPFINMGDNTMLNTISEWASPNFHGIIGIYYFLLIIIPIFLFIKNKKINIFDFLIYIMFIFMFLRSVRFFHYYVLVSTYFVGKYNIDFKIKNIKYKVNTKIIKISIYIILSVLILFGIYYQINNFNQKKLYYYSDASINKLIELKPKRLYNDYNTGGYLTNKLYGTEVGVFINGIADIYSSNILKDAFDLQSAIVDPKTILDKYNFDVLIIKRNLPLEWYLRKDSDYNIYYEDDTAIIFIKI